MPITQTRLLAIIQTAECFATLVRRMEQEIPQVLQAIAAEPSAEARAGLAAQAWGLMAAMRPPIEAITMLEREKAHFRVNATRNDRQRRRLAAQRGALLDADGYQPAAKRHKRRTPTRAFAPKHTPLPQSEPESAGEPVEKEPDLITPENLDIEELF